MVNEKMKNISNLGLQKLSQSEIMKVETPNCNKIK